MNLERIMLKLLILSMTMVLVCNATTKQRFDQVYKRIDVNKLGQGAQGEVFRVVKVDDPNGTVYAAKTYFEQISFEPAFIKRYNLNMDYLHKEHGQNNNSFGRDEMKRELAAYKRLPKNDNVGQLYEYYEEEDKRYMVMKLIEGVEFKKLMITRDKIPNEDGWHNKTLNKFDIKHTLNWAV